MSLKPKSNKTRTAKPTKEPRIISRRGKIENWHAGSVGPFGEIAWTHKDGEWDVDIENPYRGEWVVTVTEPNREGTIIDEDCTNATEARNVAVDWMRRHPNPPLEEPYTFKKKEVIPWNHYNVISWQRKEYIVKVEIEGKWIGVKVYKNGEFFRDVDAFLIEKNGEKRAHKLAEGLVSGELTSKRYAKIMRLINR